MIALSRNRFMGIAGIVVFELLAFWYFILHARSIGSGLQDGDMRLQTSRNVRYCLSGQHRDPRFVDKGTCVTPMQRLEALEELLVNFKMILDYYRIVYWIDSGTLLGQYRSRAIVPWDRDCDIGMLATGMQQLREVNPRLVPDDYRLDVFNSSLHEQGQCQREIPARFIDTRFGFYIDVFEFLETEDYVGEDVGSATLGPLPSDTWDTCSQCPYVSGNPRDAKGPKQFYVPMEWIFPLRPCFLMTFEVNCPAQPVPYLIRLYGEDFMKPSIW